MTENPKSPEVLSRGKVLIINASPGRNAHFEIAERLFDIKSDTFDSFGNAVVNQIKSPPKEAGITNTQRSNQSELALPDSVDDFKAIIVSGSPYSAYPYERKEGGYKLAWWKHDLLQFVSQAVRSGKPYFGICFGAQILAEATGGRVVEMRSVMGKKLIEKGYSMVNKSAGAFSDSVMRELPDNFVVDQNHWSVVANLPPGGVLLAENKYGVQAFKVGNAYGVEFHPERGTPVTDSLFRNFLQLAWKE